MHCLFLKKQKAFEPFFTRGTLKLKQSIVSTELYFTVLQMPYKGQRAHHFFIHGLSDSRLMRSTTSV